MLVETIEGYTLLGTQFINFHDFGSLLLKLSINLFFTLLIVRGIFYPVYKERDYVFTTVMINLTIFFVCFLMESIKLKIGFAFGLFAVFAILRYRTEQIPIREMTYMFAVIIIAVLNALSDSKISYAEVLLANGAIALAILILEKNFLHDDLVIRTITYEKIELIKPENFALLMEDLRGRTGLDIRRAEIENINFLNDTARMKIVFRRPDRNYSRIEAQAGGEPS